MSNTDFSCIVYYCVTVEWNGVSWVVCADVYLQCQATLGQMECGAMYRMLWAEGWGRAWVFQGLYEVVFELVPAWNHKGFCRMTAVYTAPPTSAVGISNEPSTVFNIPGSKYVDVCHLWGWLYSDMHCVAYWMHMCVHIAPNEYVRAGFMSPLLPVEL